MGQNFSSEPVVEKDTERDHNDTFNVAVSSCQGWRMSQEDNHSMMLELPGEHKAAFFAVYDGHGSARVSKHASESLWKHLVENELYIRGEFKLALETAFLTFDREVNASYNAQLAGTTAICLLVVNQTVYCANIGDSRAVASANCKCIPLSYDHKPENPQELKRILAAGGYVLGNRVNGNLALSRAFGDFHYKGNDQLPPEQQIVSPCPDIKTIELNDDVDFLVLACDGIWDVLSNEEVVEFVISRLEQQMEPGLICEQLTTRCLATDYELVIGCDNMTVLLVCYTRGRSWAEFCTGIFDKNSHKMGIPRTPPSLDPTSADTSTLNEVPPSVQAEVRDGQQDEQSSEQQQQTEETAKLAADTSAPNGSSSATRKDDDAEISCSGNDAAATGKAIDGCSLRKSAETTDARTQCLLKDSSPSSVEPVNGDGGEVEQQGEDKGKVDDDDLFQETKNLGENESECKQKQQQQQNDDAGTNSQAAASCNRQDSDRNNDSNIDQQESDCAEKTSKQVDDYNNQEEEEVLQKAELHDEDQKDADAGAESEQNLDCETK